MLTISKKKIFILILFLFSLLINQHYGNKGLFPVDSLAHFDTGFRVLLGEYPFKDYWVVSGPFVDYFQAIFFYFFGVNWQSYVLHASTINSVLAISTFLVLTSFKFNIYYSFIYALLFSILAYPTSGTPFVDYHSTLFSILGIYCLILGIKNEKNIYWVLLPFMFGFAFLSKQVPAAYIIISVIFILFLFSIVKKNFKWLKYFFIGLVTLIISVFALGHFQEISFSSFLDQYILYPQSIREQRFDNFSFNIGGVLNHFKFIYLSLLPLILINLKNIFVEKKYFKQNDFYIFLSIFFLTFSLIFHQLLTKNQTFIFFLIPLLIAFSHMSISSYKFSKKIFVNLLMIFVCFLITAKYHLRFNETRKFHELNYVNFKLASEAKEIDDKLVGLKWITPEFKDNSLSEIILIKEIKSHLQNDQRNKMLITNYSFFSVILDKKLYSPGRWYLSDGTDYPLKNNKFFEKYKNFFINLIKQNNIQVIYMTEPLNNSIIYSHISKNCINEKLITKVLKSFELKKCEEL